MRSDELETRFGELLAQFASDTAMPEFSAIWRAFLALAAIPVDDVGRPGADDDRVYVSVELEEDRSGTRLVALRSMERAGSALQLAIVAVFEPLPVEDFYTTMNAGSESLANTFKETVEAHQAFALLQSAAPPRAFECVLIPMGEVPPEFDKSDTTAFRSDTLAVRFGELLAETGGGAAVPTFAAIWGAFVAMASTPVEDVTSAGVDDDSIGASVGPDDREPGPQLILNRYVVRPWGTAVDLWVIADFEPFPLAERVSVLRAGGVKASVREFVETSERTPAFSHLMAAPAPRKFEYGLDEIE